MKFNVTLEEFEKSVNSKKQKDWFEKEINNFENIVLKKGD